MTKDELIIAMVREYHLSVDRNCFYNLMHNACDTCPFKAEERCYKNKVNKLVDDLIKYSLEPRCQMTKSCYDLMSTWLSNYDTGYYSDDIYAQEYLQPDGFLGLLDTVGWSKQNWYDAYRKFSGIELDDEIRAIDIIEYAVENADIIDGGTLK